MPPALHNEAFAWIKDNPQIRNLTSPGRAHAPCHAARKQLQHATYVQTIPCRDALCICRSTATLLHACFPAVYILPSQQDKWSHVYDGVKEYAWTTREISVLYCTALLLHTQYFAVFILRTLIVSNPLGYLFISMKWECKMSYPVRALFSCVKWAHKHSFPKGRH